MPTSNGYFNIGKEMEMVKAGGFFCESCLVGKPKTDISPDPRYCQGCYDFLVKEAEMLSGKGRPAWMPRTPPPEPALTSSGYVPDRAKAVPKLKHKEITIGVIGTPLEIVIVRKLHEGGVSIRAIEKKLKAEGIKTSRSTIQRILRKEVEAHVTKEKVSPEPDSSSHQSGS